LLAGLDLQIGDLAVIDLKPGARRQVQSERQLDDGDRLPGLAGDADVEQHDHLSGLGQNRALFDGAFERRVAARAGAARDPAGSGGGVGRRGIGLRGRRRRRRGLGCTRRGLGLGRRRRLGEAGRGKRNGDDECERC
jgi:hypothetical protein